MFNCTNSSLILHDCSLIYEQTVQRPVCSFIDLYCPFPHPTLEGRLSKSEERGEKSVVENVIALKSWQALSCVDEPLQTFLVSHWTAHCEAICSNSFLKIVKAFSRVTWAIFLFVEESPSIFVPSVQQQWCLLMGSLLHVSTFILTESNVSETHDSYSTFDRHKSPNQNTDQTKIISAPSNDSSIILTGNHI